MPPQLVRDRQPHSSILDLYLEVGRAVVMHGSGTTCIEPDRVIHGLLKALFAAQIPFCGFNGNVSQVLLTFTHYFRERFPSGLPSLQDHSNRNAEIGSTRVAFLAGTHTATSATAHRKIGVRTNAVGSHVFTPNRNPLKNVVSQNAPPIPTTRPIPASSIPWRTTKFRIFAACAPNAILTPSSWVRCWTEYAINP